MLTWVLRTAYMQVSLIHLVQLNTTILLRIGRMSLEADGYQPHDREHAMQSSHLLPQTTFLVRPPTHLGIYPKHQQMLNLHVANLHVRIKESTM